MVKENNGFFRNKIVIILITITITAIITFVATQQYFSQKTIESINNAQKEIGQKALASENELQKQIETLKLTNSELTIKLDSSSNNLIKETNFVKVLTDFQVYKSEYYDTSNTISESISKINITIDYTTCKLSVDKTREQHNLYADDESKTYDYFVKLGEYSNKQSCTNKIKEYDQLRKDIVEIRKKYDDTFENWCYGWHKVDWSSTWAEEYSTPWTISMDKLSESEKKLGQLYNDLIKICLSN